MGDEQRLFPIIMPYASRAKEVKAFPLRIPWDVAELAYSVYSSRYGTSQSLSRLAERGGFHVSEMDDMLPDWRERCDTIQRQAAELERLRKENECFKEGLEPGKASAIINGMFELAHRYGHPRHSARHALTFLKQQMAASKQQAAELERLREENKRESALADHQAEGCDKMGATIKQQAERIKALENGLRQVLIDLFNLDKGGMCKLLRSVDDAERLLAAPQTKEKP
jgi:hypothetical protein